MGESKIAYEHLTDRCGQEVTRIERRWYCPVHGECASDEIDRVPFDPLKHRDKQFPQVTP
jgi:hypothetical protein